jgi:hypothetical protein
LTKDIIAFSRRALTLKNFCLKGALLQNALSAENVIVAGESAKHPGSGKHNERESGNEKLKKTMRIQKIEIAVESQSKTGGIL